MLDFMDKKYIIEKFDNRTILITGASGLIGTCLIEKLFEICAILPNGLQIVAVTRCKEYLCERVSEVFVKKLDVVECDLQKENIGYDGSVDYIIHCASITDSKSFVEKPVETIMTTVTGTEKVLELAKKKEVISVVFASSMEIYGSIEKSIVNENDNGNLDILSVRSCYPEAKRLAENLCIAYFSEFGVPAKIARLAQVIGNKININDKRAVTQFAQCAKEKKDIYLKTQGESEHMFIQVYDAVEALVTILLKGEAGSVYNVANEDTFCSIYDLAIECAHVVNDEISVNICLNEDNSMYAVEHHLFLDTMRLKGLGWKPHYNLREAIEMLIRNA